MCEADTMYGVGAIKRNQYILHVCFHRLFEDKVKDSTTICTHKTEDHMLKVNPRCKTFSRQTYTHLAKGGRRERGGGGGAQFKITNDSAIWLRISHVVLE
jgi:hypothetical protein